MLSLSKKSQNIKSNFAVTGLYFYDNDNGRDCQNIKQVVESLKSPMSTRPIWAVEISLFWLMGRGFAWLNAGTHESLLQASQYIETVQRLQNVK